MSALLLAVVAVALISAIPVPQVVVDPAAENDFNQASDPLTFDPPNALAFTADEDPTTDTTREFTAVPPPYIDFGAEDELSIETADEPTDTPSSSADLPPEEDLSSDTTEAAAGPPPTTSPAAEQNPSTTGEVVDTQPSAPRPPREESPTSTTTEVPDTQPPTTSPPAPANPTTTTATTAAAPVSNAQQLKVPVYDTAWELFYGLPLSEVDEYFAYLRAKGYTGLWASVLPIGYQNGGETANSALHAKNVVGDSVAELSGGNVVLTTAHANHIKAYLDKAQQHGLELNPVIAWANNNTGPSSSGNCAAHSWGPARYPTISEGNAFAYGQSVANAFGTHPAIAYWVLGGDDIWECDSSTVWVNMRNGLRTADLGQPTTYHTGGNYNKYRDESWNEFLSAQTGWGQNTAQLGNLKAATGKITYAAEMRYYLDTGFTAEQVRAETQVALDQGVDAMLYGDVRRAHIGMRDNLYKKSDVPAINHIRDTFNSPGEAAFFSVVGS